MERSKEYKLVTLGEGRVGKTSLSLKFVNDTFNEDEKSTRNATYLNKTMNVDGTMVKLNIWDTAGQEKFRALAPNYYRQASGALIVYDITDRASFDRLISWVKELENQADPDIVIVLAGNKCDKERERDISKQEAEQYARQINVPHIMTSAKTGQGVEEVFEQLARNITRKQASKQGSSGMQTRMAKRININTQSHVLNAEEAKKKKKCC